jgi:hypothetical protein
MYGLAVKVKASEPKATIRNPVNKLFSIALANKANALEPKATMAKGSYSVIEFVSYSVRFPQ